MLSFKSRVMQLIVSTGRQFDDNAKKEKQISLFGEIISSTDLLKIVMIIVLLGASVWMHLYEPMSNMESANMNNSLITRSVRVDDNPYGFHPFYQVHERVQYKNPSVNLCDGMDPKRTLLLTILSRASNVHIREAIRQTWGATRIYQDIEIRLVFIVGVDDGMLKQIEIEQEIYHGQLH
jgi:hypothetical protein